jgi:hypothetical protein
MKIKINGTELNAIVDTDIALTKSVNKLQDLANRSGEFSTEIEAGLSSNNRILTKHSQSTDSLTPFPYSANKCEIEANGFNVLSGFARLIETNENYKIRAYGQLANLVDLIGDSKLKDLNLDYSSGSTINHIWNYANVIANRNNTYTSGFIYPNINYGKWTLNTAHAHWNDLYPSVFCKYLFLRIFHSLGYSVTGEFLSNELFEREILPMVKIANIPSFVLDGYTTEGELNNYTPNEPNFYPVTLNRFIKNSSLQLQQVSFPPEVITCYFPIIYGSINFNIDVNVNWSSPGFGAFMKLRLYKKTPSLGSVSFQEASISNGANTVSFTVENAKDAADTYFFLEFNWGGIPIWEVVSLNWETKYNNQNLVEGNTVYVNECLPDVSQKDFLLTIINQYNLMIKVDSDLRTIDFSYFNSIAGNTANKLDWSNKLDLSEKPTIAYEIDGYSQNNLMNYETDDNDNELRKADKYGNGSLFCNNLNLDNINEIFKSKFAPIVRIPCIKSPHTSTQAYIQMWISEDREASFRTQSVKPRIAYITRGETFTIHGTEGAIGGGNGSTNNGPSAGVYFQNLEFAGSLIPTYYPIISKMLIDTYFITASFNLNLADYNKVDFTQPIWLDVVVKGYGNIKGLFYLNEIKQFKINRRESTEVELIRI